MKVKQAELIVITDFKDQVEEHRMKVDGDKRPIPVDFSIEDGFLFIHSGTVKNGIALAAIQRLKLKHFDISKYEDRPNVNEDAVTGDV